ncbi:MAG: DUF547 domain-containing protein [Lewinellaceae bacterium]|nr:DUF547 domain-containing protein [Lewinellaceae bacterium]
MDVVKFSEQLLHQVRSQKPVAALVEQLASIRLETIRLALDTDDRKKAFWINLYNAFFQLLRSEKQVAKPAIFRQKLVVVAGNALSLDDIEHGILRRNRIKWALGYLADPFAPVLLKQLAVSSMDYRIHFSLHCGARSCPPIAFYTAGKIDQQLESATLSFLQSDTEVVEREKEVHVTALFRWYLGDFGGARGVRRLLKENLGLETSGMRLVIKDYDWTEQFDDFSG